MDTPTWDEDVQEPMLDGGGGGGPASVFAVAVIGGFIAWGLMMQGQWWRAGRQAAVPLPPDPVPQVEVPAAGWELPEGYSVRWVNEEETAVMHERWDCIGIANGPEEERELVEKHQAFLRERADDIRE